MGSHSETDKANKYIWIVLPDTPDPKTLDLNGENEANSWLFSFTTGSVPLSTIALRLNPHNKKPLRLLDDTTKSKTENLESIFELLNSPIEKFNLAQLIIPHRARGALLTKHQLIRHLLIYTKTDCVKSGVIRTMIDNIKVGKPSESPTLEFIYNIISVLQHFWEECSILKNNDYNRIVNACLSINNQLTLRNLSLTFDCISNAKSESVKTEYIFPSVEYLFDILYEFAKIDDYGSKISIELVIGSILNKSMINERVVFNALCMKPRGLASLILYSRGGLWDVIYGIEYLKNKNVTLWKKILDLSNKSYKRGKKANTKDNINLVVKISVGIPCSIMRCIRMYGEYDNIVDKISIFKDNIRQESEGYCIEEKLDGERSCLHIWRHPDDKNKIITKFYSRGRLLQLWYGSYVGDPDGIITKYLRPEWFEGINDMILDGEMVTFDESKDILLGFQDVKSCSETLTEALKNGEDLTKLKIYNRLMVYDILYLNGESLQLTPLKARKNKLIQVLGKFDSKFLKTHEWNVGHNANDLQIAMTNIIGKNSEGLVIKNWESFYFVGKHSSAWIKMKPYYLMDFIDELDLTIIGKEGSNYICALYGDDNGDIFRGWFVSFCLVRFGFTNEFLQYIEGKTEGHWKSYNKYESEIEMQDHRVRFGKLKPNFWIYPENSLVITVKAKSISKCKENTEINFLLSSTLRFPYCTDIRYDKEYIECDTVSDYMKKVEKRGNKNPFGDDNDDNVSGAKFGKRVHRKVATKMEIALRGVNENFVQTFIKKDDLFKGITFCVKSDCTINGKWLPLNEVNGILESHGGKITSDPKHNIHGRLIIIADKHTLSVNNLRKEFDIFKFKWCEDCIRSEKLVQLDPTHCLIVDDLTMSECIGNRDKFGCNYTIEYSDKQIWDNSKRYGNVERDDDGNITNFELTREQCDILGFKFYGRKFKMFGYDDSNSFQRESLEIRIEIHGGEVVTDIEDADTVVLFDSKLEGNVKKLNKSIKIIEHSNMLKEMNEIRAEEKEGKLII